MEQLGIFLGALAIAFFFLGPSVFNGILFGGVVYWVVGLFAPGFAIPAGVVLGFLLFISTPNR